MMQKLLSYLLSPIYWIVFLFTMGIFHPIQWICYYVFGPNTHRRSVEFLNLLLIYELYIVNIKIKTVGLEALDKNKRYLILANHQSMADIPPIIYYLRKTHPKLVGKKELGKGIPSISFNVNHGGGYLIDRKNRASALQVLHEAGLELASKVASVMIFPEGTRSKDGRPLPWRIGGISQILNANETVDILPISINGTWRIYRHKWVLPFGSDYQVYYHPTHHWAGEDIKSSLKKIETQVNQLAG